MKIMDGVKLAIGWKFGRALTDEICKGIIKYFLETDLSKKPFLQRTQEEYRKNPRLIRMLYPNGSPFEEEEEIGEEPEKPVMGFRA